MLPYHELHAPYVAGSGLAAVLAWALLRRLTPLPRLLTAMAAIAVLCGLSAIEFPEFLDFRDARGFAVISITFYADGLWLPLLALVHLVRSRREAPPRGRLVAALSLAAIGVSLWAMLVEPNRVGFREETVVVPGWPADAEPFVLVHVSDLQSVGECERERRALERINAYEPDLVVVTGDYMAGPFWDPVPGIDAARTFLTGLRARHGVLGVAGHAEPAPMRDRIFDGLEARYLRDAWHDLELEDGRALEICALEVHHPDLALLDRPVRPGAVRLVASHVPDVSRELDGRGVLLHLAGHTHGGQIALPLVGPPLTLSELPRAYARGLHRFGDHLLNVCAGLGMEGNHAPRIRFLCPPEVCVIRLVGSPAGSG